MSGKPKCIIITGRPGSGKTTLAKKLSERLWLPVISRDELKAGYVNTFGVKHDQLSPDANRVVTDLFFEAVNQYLTGNISVIAEAAFQHEVWGSRIPKLVELSSLVIVLCSVDSAVAARRHLQRGLDDPMREFFHGDRRVTHYKATGEFLKPEVYAPPRFDVPTIEVTTDENYNPSINELAAQICSLMGL